MINLDVNSFTSFLIFACSCVFSISSKTSAIKPAIFTNSASFIPRAVSAGEPRRIPEVTNGLLVSPGTVFLFAVIPAFPSAISASFPLNGLFRKLRSTTWLSVPPLRSEERRVGKEC